MPRAEMKKFLAIVISLCVTPLSVVAQEGLICPAVMLCDQNGEYFEWADPTTECAKQQHEFCSKRRLAAEQNEVETKRLRHYTRVYSRCLNGVEKELRKKVARGHSAKAQRLQEKKLKAKRCGKYAKRVRKLTGSTR